MRTWWVLPLLLASACESNSRKLDEPRVVEINEIPEETMIPPALWDQIEIKVHPKDGESSQEGTGVLFMPVSVILREKNPGVLVEPALKLEFPRGGGTVDFARYTTGVPGTFYVSFEWPEADKLESLRVWYDSKGRRRKLEDGSWGSGCGRFYELTPKFSSEMKKGGLMVNTTRDRHLTVLGGHFIFSLEKAKQTYVAKITFKDSKKPVLFCEEL